MFSRTRRCAAQALVEFALVLPMIMLLSLGSVQLVLYAHARDVLLSSAQEAARLASEDGRSLSEGFDRARGLVSAGIGTSVDPLTVDGSMDSELVHIRLDARLRPVLPLSPDVPLHAEASITRERFRPSGAP